MQFKPKTEHDRGCSKTYLDPSKGVPNCPCGVTDPNWNPRPFFITPKDIAKWADRPRRLYEVLKDGEYHEKQDWMRQIGITQYPSRVVSDLRKLGGVIPKPKREGDMSFYKMTGFNDSSTISNGIHYPDCKTCRCKD